MRQRLEAIANLTILAGSLVGAVLTSHADDWQPVGLVVVLLAIAVLSQLLSVGVGQIVVSASSSAYVLAMALLGPAPAVAIALASILADQLRQPPARAVFLGNVSAHAFFPLVGGLLIEFAAERTGLGPADAEFGLLVFATYMVTTLLNWVQIAIGEHLHGRETFGQASRQIFIPMLPIETMAAVGTAVICYAYGHVGLPALAVFGLVAVPVQLTIREVLRSHDRVQRIANLAEDRRRLVAQVLEAEERERRALADALHDEALQNVLTASQEIEEAQRGDQEALRRARVAIDRTVAQLRDEVFELHPVVLKHGGLEPALRAVAEQQARRAGLKLSVEIDPRAAGDHDQLLLSVGRELLINATKHSGASALVLRVARHHEQVVLEVRDDGRGFDPGLARRGVGQGHIGLASISERVEAVGGRMRIAAAPGTGANVVVTIPRVGTVAPPERSELDPAESELGPA